MVRPPLAAVFLAATLLAPSSIRAQTELWSHAIGDTQDDDAVAVDVDPDDRIVVVGTYRGTIDFGGDPISSVGGSDVYLVRYDVQGDPLWIQSFGSTADDVAYDVDVDLLGRIHISGDAGGPIDFGGGILSHSGGTDMFVASFDSLGTHLSSHMFGDNSSDQGLDVAANPEGLVGVSGVYRGTVDFGAGPLGPSDGDAVVSVNAIDGTHLWTTTFGPSSFQAATGIGMDLGANVGVTGTFFDSLVVDVASYVSAGQFDIFVARLESGGGAPVWSHAYGDTGDDQGWDTALDGASHHLVTGSFEGTVDFGGGPLQSAGGRDIFVVKFAGDGGHLWSRSFGSPGDDLGTGISVDSANNVFVTGTVRGPVDFGGGPLAWSGQGDVFVLALNSAGSHLWSATYGDNDPDEGLDIAPCEPAGVVAVGAFANQIDFGGGPLSDAGPQDGFVVKLDAPVGLAAPEVTVPFRLRQNRPNPFGLATRIEFRLEEDAEIVLDVHDVSGRRLTTLVEGFLPAGPHSVTWGGRDELGERLPAGVYFYRLRIGGESLERKALLVR